MANEPPDEAQAGMDAWTEWANRAGSALVEFGTPTTAVGSVGPAGSAVGSAGSAGSAGGFVGGYSIMQADSTDALKRMLENHPHLTMDGSSIEIYELLEVPGQG
ncbi:hypothetical protein J7E25_09575 [Agromyces sp. ISL-38]|uniref:YciI family protein n=1 Tax=Agromyces sp. ISL-38 TaxID=2819107 RepID=UPI001BE5CACA|nr:YciI family protein [Agromyces sp. ISL-38]MBT2499348.1 hypothetical protein [Agromyces sp. ISL-38]MBT2518115.1 hypothetical protein [Streptomyces sp. ISL-90]